MVTEVICVALSGVGVAFALLLGWRRRFLAAVRMLAVALLPVGLYLTGLLTMFRRIGTAIGDWGAGLVIRPQVYLGAVLLAVAVLLFLAAHQVGRRRRKRRRGARGAEREAAVEPAAGKPSVPAGDAAATAKKQRPLPPAAAKGDTSADSGDFKEIEDILRRHGI